MSRLIRSSIAFVALFGLAACADSTAPLRPSPPSPSLERGAVSAAVVHQFDIWDRCDPATFNAVLGPGACARREGGVKFEDFLKQVGTLHQAPGWRFIPTNIQLKLGESFVAFNHGGEVHTFTEVEDYGGGVVQSLNDLSGNPVPAPECLALAPGDLLAVGTSTAPDTPDEVGVEKYQCCIHPWMRATVTVVARR